jgi:hypothetical protein
MSHPIRTKLGQAPSDSPRTLDSNRRRLGSLFSTLLIGESAGASSSKAALSGGPDGTPSKASKKVGWLEWLSPVKATQSEDPDEEAGEDNCKDRQDGSASDELEGSLTLDLGAGRARSEIAQTGPLYGLPDEL